jgi:hypothetical protein
LGRAAEAPETAGNHLSLLAARQQKNEHALTSMLCGAKPQTAGSAIAAPVTSLAPPHINFMLTVQ